MRRPHVPFKLALVAIFALPVLGYFLFLRAPAPQAQVPSTNEEPSAAHVPLLIDSVTGKVEVRAGGGAFRAARAGELLAEDDEIRTDASASAALRAEGRYLVRIDPSSTFRIVELTTSADRLLLDSGFVAAEVQPGRGLSISAGKTDATAIIDEAGASFRMSSDGAGTAALATTAGVVQFRSAKKTVAVRAGELTVAQAGEAPSAPTPIPPSLLLKVSWPKKTVTTKAKLAIRGTTTPGALVRVAGKPVRVGVDGNFATVVALKKGTNRLAVESRGVAGGEARAQSPPVLLDRGGRGASFDTRDLWDEP